MIKFPTPETLQRMMDVVGPKAALRDESDKAPYLKEWRGLWTGQTPVVLRPASTDEVSRILAIAHETGTAIVPYSGGTGLVGGQIPNNGEVLLSLDRMTRILNVDAADYALVAEAGATLKSIQDAAEKVDRLFPLSLASEGTCRIGGNLATNAGGLNVVYYGNTRDLCLGLEVVLADGRILNRLKTLRKDNSGYDLKNLFIGSEGTLGIITAAALKLFPRPRSYATALVAVPTPAAALELLAQAKQASASHVIAFELLPEIGIQFTVKHMGTRRAVETISDWYVLLEMADVPEGLLDTLLENALEEGIISDATVAQSDGQRKELWALRENMSESQRYEGGSIKHDVSVPMSKLSQFIAEASNAVSAFQPGVRICCFGHMGDGNMHFNVSQPIGMDKQAYLDRWHDMNRIVHDIAMSLNGSFSAEHGIGILKTGDMLRYKSAVELSVMRDMKKALDPKNILSPGRVLPRE
jgi:FAD/FMN-containing dehydrogenase